MEATNNPNPAPTPVSRRSTTQLALPPGPVAKDNQHVCFICLLNDAETPDEKWVNPCPCTLEAHEDCMLRWVAETETQQSSSARNKNGLRCPACNARIYVDEPWDPVVALRERLHRAYSRSSPLVLLFMVVTGGMAGSAYYGLVSAQIFAGPLATTRWLGLLQSQRTFSRGVKLSVLSAPVLALGAKIWALSLVGPTLVISRALPSVASLVTIPASILYGIALVARDDMPSWPPSPEWAIALLPYVQLTYNNIYNEFFGPLDRRLNRALRGRPPVEEQEQEQQLGQQDPQQRQQGDADVNARAAAAAQDEDEGLWATIWGLGHAIVHLFGEDDVVIEAEVHVNDEAHLEDELLLDEIEVLDEELEALQREVEAEEAQRDAADGLAADAVPAGEHQQAADQAEDDDEAALPPDIPRVRLDPAAQAPPAVGGGGAADQGLPQPAQQPQQQAGPPPAADDNRASATLNDIANSVVTSLLLPVIGYGVGELLRAAAPRAWVEPPRRPHAAAGLLQQRWGRSLAGGCLFVVLKDAFALYAKYRRVQVKRQRKVRNVDREKLRASKGQA